MKIDQIFDEWGKDSKIDINNLEVESLNIPYLHHKYYKILIDEKQRLTAAKASYAAMHQQKFEFYTSGPTEDTQRLGWTLPPRGKIIKNDVEPYLTNDPDLVPLALRVGLMEEKISLIVSILDTIKNRSFHVKNAIDFIKFKNGL